MKFQPGDRVTVLSNGKAYKGQIVSLDTATNSYHVKMVSGSIWRAYAMWVKSRTVRNPANF